MTPPLLPRPSALPQLEACPRWVSRPDQPDEKKNSIDEAADEGTQVHGKMEALAQVPLVDWESNIFDDLDLSADLKVVVQDCATQVRDLFQFGLPVVTKKLLGLGPDEHYELGRMTDEQVEQAYGYGSTIEEKAAWDLASSAADAIYCEAGVDPVVVAPGTADLIVVFGNRAVLVDYKTNRVLRSHDRQQQAYVLGVFNSFPNVNYVSSRIVCPRLGVEAHPTQEFERDRDYARLFAGLKEIVDSAADLFTPGCPGEPCSFCAGNGRCPYQAASLRDVPQDASALLPPGIWRNMLVPQTREIRGQRRALVRWLGSFVDAVKDDDKQWALDHPDDVLPGFTKSVGLGRTSLDKDRLGEINEALSLTLGWDYPTLVSFLVPDRTKIAEFAALARGISVTEAEKLLNRALAPFEKRGAPIISFRAVKTKEGKSPALAASE